MLPDIINNFREKHQKGEIKLGLSKQDVVLLIGEPDRVTGRIAKDVHIEILYYEAKANFIHAHFANDKLFILDYQLAR